MDYLLKLDLHNDEEKNPLNDSSHNHKNLLQGDCYSPPVHTEVMSMIIAYS